MRTPRLSLLAAQLGLLLAPLAGQALEVGPLQVSSHSGQPLVAEIWVSGSSIELSDLSARAAAAELYAGAQVPFSRLASRLSLVVERRAQDRAVILVRSNEPVPEGSSTLLVDLRWPGGGLVRGYRFALDAPPNLPMVAAAPAPQVTQVPAPQPPAQPAAAAPSAVASPATPPATASPAAPGEAGQYLTQEGDTLHGIARNEEIAGTSVQQRMAAIYSLNPQHFAGGDPNRLRAGATLRMPSAEEARQRSETAAQEVLIQASRQLSAQRGEIARAAAAAPAQPENVDRHAKGRIRNAPGDEVAPREQARLTIAEGSERGRPQQRLATLEEEVASNARMLAERDARLRELEEMVTQLNQLIRLQQTQLDTLRGGGASAPLAQPAQPELTQVQGLLTTTPSSTGPLVEDRRGPPPSRAWYRLPAVQLGVVVLALLSFSALVYTLVQERIEERRRRERRAARKRRKATQAEAVARE